MSEKQGHRRVHYLKTWVVYFELVRSGLKTFEMRKNDRNFQAGDVLILEEWDPVTQGYTGRSSRYYIGIVLDDPRFGVAPGWCCLSLLSTDAAKLIIGNHALRKHNRKVR